MRVLGIDPGSRVCGYGVISIGGERSYQYVECGVVRPDRAGTMEQRLAEIARSLTEVVQELDPAVLAVESVFTHINVRSALALAHARGVVLAVAGLAGVPVFSYAPTVVKRAVTGRGRASKEQVSRMVQSLVGLQEPPTADAADALAVAITHANQTESL